MLSPPGGTSYSLSFLEFDEWSKLFHEIQFKHIAKNVSSVYTYLIFYIHDCFYEAKPGKQDVRLFCRLLVYSESLLR